MTQDRPKPGTPIFIVEAELPVIESFGFESDLRYHTQVMIILIITIIIISIPITININDDDNNNDDHNNNSNNNNNIAFQLMMS